MAWDLELSTDKNKIIDILGLAVQNSSLVLTWQILGNSKRDIFPSSIYSIDKSSETFFIENKDQTEYTFLINDIFFYIHDVNILFKAENISVQNNIADFSYPETIKVLSDDNLKLSLINIVKEQGLDEFGLIKVLSSRNEDVYKETIRISGVTEKIDTTWRSSLADKRIAPRSKPDVEKLVSFSRVGLSGVSSYELFDLSQTGFSFIAGKDMDFNLEDELEILSIDEDQFDQKLVASVVNMRELDDHYKIGCRFKA